MDKDRLLYEKRKDKLTKQAIREIDESVVALVELIERNCTAQVEAATLRTVGEWLDSLVTETGMPLFVDYKYVEALRNGKTPEGWERWKKGR